MGAADILYYVTVRYLLLFAIVLLRVFDGTQNGSCRQPACTGRDEARRAADTRHRLVAFGDSLTAGFGAEPGASYPDFLQKTDRRKTLSLGVINAGVSGDTCTDGLARLPGVLDYKPEIVILELGANDGLRGIPVEATRSNLDQIVVALQGAGAKVVLAGMTLPPNYGPDYIRPFEKVFTDLHGAIQADPDSFSAGGRRRKSRLMQQDGLHPTAEGYRVVADNVMKVVEPLLLR